MRSIWIRQASRLAWGKIFTAFGLSLAVTAATVSIFGMMGNPATLAVIEAESEYVRYRVFNENMAAFPGEGLRITLADDFDLEGQCAGGSVSPHSESVVEYISSRGSAGMVVVVSGSAQFTTRDGIEGRGEVALVSDRSCGRPAAKFPVWGPGQVGSIFAVRNDGVDPVLLSGEVDVFGRTLHLGPLGAGGALYSATPDPMRLPAGGAIWTDGGGAGERAREAPESSALFGFVATRHGQALQVNVTTEAPEIEIIAPGGELDPSRIEIGFFAQAINDPNILRLQLSFVVFFLLFPIAMDFVLLATAKESK